MVIQSILLMTCRQSGPVNTAFLSFYTYILSIDSLLKKKKGETVKPTL